MTVRLFTRAVAVVGIGAVALLGLNAPVRAQSQQAHGQQAEQKKAKPQKAEKQAQQAEKKQEHEQVRQEHLSAQDQQVLIHRQELRLEQYRKHLDQQQRVAEKHSAQLQRQSRKAQFRYQQQYLARLRQQQLQIQNLGRYNYAGDPYFYTPSTYRYVRDGRSYETNQYGADLLQHAVNYGYEEGSRAGLADRQDRWDFNYQDSYAYQDGNYGYEGFYVDRDDYNSYFREGFRRGYEDGYNSRAQYGTYSNGKGTLLETVLAAILSFQSIR